ncbi:hypothetical protein EV182_007905, partial [Spiromyces aspiralis]
VAQLLRVDSLSQACARASQGILAVIESINNLTEQLESTYSLTDYPPGPPTRDSNDTPPSLVAGGKEDPFLTSGYLAALGGLQARQLESRMAQLWDLYQGQYAPAVRTIASLDTTGTVSVDECLEQMHSPLSPQHPEANTSEFGDMTAVAGISPQWTKYATAIVAKSWVARYTRHLDLFRRLVASSTGIDKKCQISASQLLERFNESPSEFDSSIVSAVETEIQSRLRIYRLAKQYQAHMTTG